MKKYFILFSLSLIILSGISAQDSFLDVPDRFGKIILGMNIKDTENEIEADGNFNFRGSQDLSILQRPNQSLIECMGYDFVDRAFFQFKDDKLYSITILFNMELIDHYSLFTTLSKKYGDPDDLNPERSIWKSDKNILILERPLQIKYLDRKVFEGMGSDVVISKSLSELSREQFLEQF